MIIVVMPVHTDAAHTHETVTSGPRPPSSAACKIKVIGPAKEISTAMSPAFHADTDESCQTLRRRWSNPKPHSLVENGTAIPVTIARLFHPWETTLVSPRHPADVSPITDCKTVNRTFTTRQFGCHKPRRS